MTEIIATTVTTTDFIFGDSETTTYAISGTITDAQEKTLRADGWAGWVITLDGETVVHMATGSTVTVRNGAAVNLTLDAPQVGQHFATTGAEARIKGDGYSTDAAAAGRLN